MINTDRGVSFTNNTTERLIPDCDTVANPDLSNNRVSSQSIEVSGAGVYDETTGKFFIDWWKDAEKKAIYIEVGGVGGERILCNAILSSLNITGSHDELVQADMTLTIDTDGLTTATIA